MSELLFFQVSAAVPAHPYGDAVSSQSSLEVSPTTPALNQPAQHDEHAHTSTSISSDGSCCCCCCHSSRSCTTSTSSSSSACSHSPHRHTHSVRSVSRANDHGRQQTCCRGLPYYAVASISMAAPGTPEQVSTDCLDVNARTCLTRPVVSAARTFTWSHSPFFPHGTGDYGARQLATVALGRSTGPARDDAAASRATCSPSPSHPYDGTHSDQHVSLQQAVPLRPSFATPSPVEKGRRERGPHVPLAVATATATTTTTVTGHTAEREQVHDRQASLVSTTSTVVPADLPRPPRPHAAPAEATTAATLALLRQLGDAWVETAESRASSAPATTLSHTPDGGQRRRHNPRAQHPTAPPSPAAPPIAFPNTPSPPAEVVEGEEAAASVYAVSSGVSSPSVSLSPQTYSPATLVPASHPYIGFAWTSASLPSATPPPTQDHVSAEAGQGTVTTETTERARHTALYLYLGQTGRVDLPPSAPDVRRTGEAVVAAAAPPAPAESPQRDTHTPSRRTRRAPQLVISSSSPPALPRSAPAAVPPPSPNHWEKLREYEQRLRRLSGHLHELETGADDVAPPVPSPQLIVAVPAQPDLADTKSDSSDCCSGMSLPSASSSSSSSPRSLSADRGERPAHTRSGRERASRPLRQRVARTRSPATAAASTTQLVAQDDATLRRLLAAVERARARSAKNR